MQLRFSRREFIARSSISSAAAMAASTSFNEKIQAAREAALEILKPSRKDLEHGLELHRDSVVFDAYGFAPGAAIDGDAYRTAIASGASELELRDLQEEMAMTRCVKDPAERKEYTEAWEASGVTCIFQNAGEEGQDPVRMLKRLARFTYVTDTMGGFVNRAIRPADVVNFKKRGTRCLYFSSNGVPLVQRWVSLEEELSLIRIFFQIGMRMMHLTYNRRNMLGDGCGEPANAGLSDLGKAAITEMNRVGIIVDVAHSGWQTSLEAARASSQPMVASHTGSAAVHMHYRCKPDPVNRAIAETGGYIGVCCIPSFLGGGINAMLAHIGHLTKTVGVDHVAIGTDVQYTSRNAIRERAKVPQVRKTREPFRSLWPPDPRPSPVSQQEALSLAWTNWPLFTVGLVQCGYSDADIRKMIGENALRVAGAVLPTEAM